MVAPRNLGQQVALQMGWTGEGQGQGGHLRWVDALTPAQRIEYDRLTGGNQNAAVKTMPLLQEPLHPYEKQGLEQYARPVDTSGMQDVLSMLRERLGQASGMVEGGTAPVGFQEVEAVRNPYASALKAKLSDTAERIRAQATATEGLRGGRSFGDTATGNRLGLIDQAEIQGQGEIEYNTYNDALAQINSQRNRLLTGAGTQYSGATAGGNTAYNMASGISQVPITDAMRKRESGGYIRGYNQNINDIIAAEDAARQGYDLNKIASVLKLTEPYQSGVRTGQTGGMVNPYASYGNMVTAVTDALQKAGLFS